MLRNHQKTMVEHGATHLQITIRDDSYHCHNVKTDEHLGCYGPTAVSELLVALEQLGIVVEDTTGDLK